MTLRQGSSIRKAAAGLERLLLSDDERVAHCDGSALLVGYLLGLPCFCYRPDVVEAVKLLRESPDSLDAFKQPAAATACTRQCTSTTSTCGWYYHCCTLLYCTPVVLASTAVPPSSSYLLRTGGGRGWLVLVAVPPLVLQYV